MQISSKQKYTQLLNLDTYSLATAAENVDGNDKLVKYGGFA